MSFGPYHEAARIPLATARSRTALEKLATKSKVIYHKEGLTTTVTVKEVVKGVRALYINGKPDASSLSDLPSQEMVAHIALLLHPNPKRALVLGLASGISLGSAGLHPLEHIDCVEISPAMIKASRYFDEDNYRILDDPRVEVIITDGRNHLDLTDKQYDVIISQPSNPYLAGVADLFTREFFEICRDRLTTGGIMCTWVQAYNIGLDTFKSITHTFQTVFPNMRLWRTGKSDCLLVGSTGELAVDYAAFARRLQADKVAADLRRIDIETVPDFLAQLVMGPEGTRRFAEGATIHTDDNALVEFSAPRALTRQAYHWDLITAIEQNREVDLSFLKVPDGETDAGDELRRVKEEAGRFIQARGHVFRAHLLMNQERRQEAKAEIHEAARLNPSDTMLKEFNASDHRRAYYLAKEDKVEEAVALYREMIERVPGDDQAHYNLATLLKRHGDLQAAFPHYLEAARLKPDYTYALYNAGELSERFGRVNDAVRYYRRALQTKSDFLPAMTNLARILAIYPDPAVRNVNEAVRLAEKAARIADNKVPLVLDTLSLAYASAGRSEEAEKTLERAIQLATDQGDQRYAKEMRGRLRKYRQQ
jgi:spermidine synthase